MNLNPAAIVCGFQQMKRKETLTWDGSSMVERRLADDRG